MSETAKWYVVHTYSGYEKKVAATIQKAVENRKLHDLILNLKVPTEEVTEIVTDPRAKSDGEVKSKTKTTRVVEKKLFPGYVLINMVMTDESWHVVRNTRGVTGFVGPGSKPVPLTDAEVSALAIEVHEIVVDYQVGDSVKIIDGPFMNFIGAVEEILLDKNIVRVVVNMFGRETPVELNLDQVEAIA